MSTPLLLIVILSFLGIINTAYLSSHIATKKDAECFLLPKKWCRKVQYSKYSKTLGIPNAYLGLLLYSAILTLTLLFTLGALPYSYSMVPVAILIITGFLFSLYFSALQVFILRAFCTWCIISMATFTLLAAVLLVYKI